MGRFVRRHRAISAAAVVTALALIVGVGGLAVGLRRSHVALSRVEASHRLLHELFRNDPILVDPRDDPELDAKALLDQWAATIESAEGEPALRANLHLSLAGLYGALGWPASATPHLEKAVELRTEVFGPDEPRTLGAADELARHLSAIFGAEAANAVAVPAAERAARVLPAGNLTRCRLERQAARGLADMASSERALRALVEEQSSTLGPTHIETMITRRYWLQRVAALEQYDELDVETESLIEDFSNHYPTDSNCCAASSDHGFQLLRQHRLDEAEHRHREALECRERLLSPHHPSRAASMHGLARVLAERWRADPAAISPMSGRRCEDEAGELWTEALRALRDAPLHRGVLEAAYGRFLGERGEIEQALTLLASGTTHLDAAVGSDDPRARRAHRWLAELGTAAGVGSAAGAESSGPHGGH